MAERSTRTVLVALASNAVVAVAKIIAGVASGSSAMLSEGAHSVADTTNEVFLLTALWRSSRPADRSHPFGYGMERFFWSLLAAVGIFVSGAAFSIYEGVKGLVGQPAELGNPILSYAVLGFAFITEGISLITAVRQLRGEARSTGRPTMEHVRRSPDPTVKTVFSEDSAALVGLAMAATGLGLRQATGAPQWDAAAALAIGLLLAFVAIRLGHGTKELLIGAAADPELREQVWQELAGAAEVDAVVEVLTMQLAPEEVLVAARLDLVDGIDSDGLEALSTRLDEELQERHPEITQVFLDATRASAHERGRSRRITQR
ncbi:MAG TPA: cation diffusion facilitator family transporter [Mycobacteriales bacterium]|jgi:cation diffusion facilitator family transporter|nr:cation diffusion facilitator family transporter [Mycobacteriales bacterium]